MEINIKLTLEDRDFEALSLRCFENELSPQEVLNNFVCDLLGTENSGGSDERMYAESWFDRRHSDMRNGADRRFDELMKEKLIALVKAWQDSANAFGYPELHDYVESQIENNFQKIYGFNPCDLIDEWLDDYCEKNNINIFWTEKQEEESEKDT